MQFRTTFFCSGDKPPQDAQDYKDELNRITKYITDLDAQTRKECDAYSEVFHGPPQLHLYTTDQKYSRT